MKLISLPISLIICLIFSNISQAETLNVDGVPSIFSQESLKIDFQITIERKVQRLMNCEKGIYELTLDAIYIQETLVPEMEIERRNIAPHYPDISSVFGKEKEALITDWILNYESEYNKFIIYFEDLLRSHT